ncbi:bifunctional 4-hydroxy-2-oxoglutarate aldolase/2-dehydro-3-deoxy-phosphogluconate aldolase [Planctomicrobium sp. SH668]|uniref:bifunctional 4-hydroxy-2-oxoglutarate aldolase/2-dehydro-3-deoxy-phosphogluconate aldolase n=1 Tax=Planctomicrobium sp. SH668 TaxID=3448126 RepID=UPI003F5C4C24
MGQVNVVEKILDRGLVAIIRAENGDQLLEVSKALIAGGIDVIEVTFTIPDVLKTLTEIKTALGDQILLGAGTVLDPETARAAILAGAEYIVTPVVREEVIKLCRRYNVPCLAGAYTPTEVLTAWEAGAEIVKLFPGEIGGPAHLKALKGPLPQIRIMPTGGVNLDTLPEFIKAGACAVGMGSSLVEKDALARGDMQRIQQLAAAYVAKLKECRK